jgi:hypothetical protein
MVQRPLNRKASAVRSGKADVVVAGAVSAAEHSPSQTKMTRIPDRAGAHHLSDLSFEAAQLASFLPGGTQRTVKVPGNYHRNLLALTGLPTIKHYELPSALILPG